MRKCSLPRTHLWVAILIAMGIPGIASAELTGDLLTGLSYYSTFEDPEKGIAAELPEENPGAWNTNTGGSPSFITVSGEHRALNLASYNAWTSNQAVLSVEDEAFTIAFTAKTGTSANGILFAFGDGHGNGGLSFRRDETPGSLAVCTGRNVECLLSAPEDGSDVAYHHYALIQDAGKLTLYVDGVAIGDPVEPSGAVIIDSKFQWRSRYGRTLDGEAVGSGAIDALGVWKHALKANEIQAVAAEMAPPTPPPLFPLLSTFPRDGQRNRCPGKLCNAPSPKTWPWNKMPYSVRSLMAEQPTWRTLRGAMERTIFTVSVPAVPGIKACWSGMYG